eukprot:XP_012809141.1 PREDICTED: uncharacterized protein LOC100495765 isoform X2 [Xenopus tropicalis]
MGNSQAKAIPELDLDLSGAELYILSECNELWGRGTVEQLYPEMIRQVSLLSDLIARDPRRVQKVNAAPGDMIEFLGKKSQWAVCTGGGKAAFRTERGLVEEKDIGKIPGGRSYRVNNKFDQKLKPLSGALVMKEARRQLGRRCAEDNDELFVTQLRYGMACSDEDPPPNTGEILCFLFQSQEHWGIYTGDSAVVYLDRGLQEGFSEPSETAYVQEVPLTQLKGVRVINKYDQKLKPKKQGDVAIEAKQKIGERMTWGEKNDTDQLFVTELRYGVKVSDKRPLPEVGDLIEFLQDAKNHWAVYVGDGKAVHRAEHGLVEEDYTGRIAGGHSYRVNNKFDRKLKPRSSTLVVKDVCRQLGKRCAEDSDELFATQLRYGIACSDENPPPDAGEILCYSFQNKEHWGIYTGESTVVYLDRGLQEGFPEPSETAYVQEVPLTQLKGIKVINKYDQMLKPKKQVDIAIEAKQRIGEKVTWGEDDDTDQLFLTELRYGMKVSNKQPPPEPGDLIEFVRLWGAYSHWGVYVGDGNLVHLQPNSKSIFNSLSSFRGK